jgi:MFS family permease
MTQPYEGRFDSTSDAVYRKVSWRLIPLLFLCYIVAYLDRVNVGFAKLQMQGDLQFSEAVYGLGAGIFFIGYFLFEVPSNVVLHRVGARRWIARIMITWGVLSAATMFVSSPMSFYVIRFLLGAAEAGFFPGIILYLTYWYPAARRGKATSLFLAAIPFAGILGGPISGWILQGMSGVNGWAGWQWLFLLQGLPTVALGVVVWRYLDDRVKDAQWLAPAERELIARDIAAEDAGKPKRRSSPCSPTPRVALGAGVLLVRLGALRHLVLAAEHHQGDRREGRARHRPAQRHPLGLRRRRDVPGGAQRRPPARVPLAQRHRGRGRRRSGWC